MSSQEYQTPHLASVLRTLASLTPQNRQQANPELSPYAVQVPPIQTTEPWQQNSAQGALGNPTATTSTNQKIIDPATIVDWSAGLRCVMKTVANHETILQDIRRMIKIQHEHEEQWWKGREALAERQKARKEGQKKLDDMLKALGGTVSSGSSNTSPEELAKELQTYDLKVHRAQTQMVREMSAKLRNLGVPFFETRTELVRSSKPGRDGTGYDGAKDENGLIDEIELVNLQRKMLALLEDLCSD